MNWKRVIDSASATGVCVVGAVLIVASYIFWQMELLIAGLLCWILAWLWEISSKLSQLLSKEV